MKQTLYFGGPILTMDLEMPRAEAVLTQDGNIAAVGSLEELRRLAPDAQQADLHGHTLMPGFVDGHSHLASVGLLDLKCNLDGCTSFDEILQRIRQFRQERKLTHGETIICPGYDLALLREHAHPSAALLDSLGFDNPIICIHQSVQNRKRTGNLKNYRFSRIF